LRALLEMRRGKEVRQEVRQEVRNGVEGVRRVLKLRSLGTCSLATL
jgi:hypothetical protein